MLKPPKWNLHRLSTLPLRLIVGYGFMEHGYAKLIHGPERFVAILHALAVPVPELMAWATIMVELLVHCLLNNSDILIFAKSGFPGSLDLG